MEFSLRLFVVLRRELKLAIPFCVAVERPFLILDNFYFVI